MSRPRLDGETRTHWMSNSESGGIPESRVTPVELCQGVRVDSFRLRRRALIEEGNEIPRLMITHLMRRLRAVTVALDHRDSGLPLPRRAPNCPFAGTLPTRRCFDPSKARSAGGLARIIHESAQAMRHVREENPWSRPRKRESTKRRGGARNPRGVSGAPRCRRHVAERSFVGLRSGFSQRTCRVGESGHE